MTSDMARSVRRPVSLAIIVAAFVLSLMIAGTGRAFAYELQNYSYSDCGSSRPAVLIVTVYSDQPGQYRDGIKGLSGDVAPNRENYISLGSGSGKVTVAVRGNPGLIDQATRVVCSSTP